MGLVIDRSSVSTLAKKLKAAQTGKNLTHQQLLEAIAQGLGFSNYGALNHHLSSASAGKDASSCHASCSMRLPDADLSIPMAVTSGESWKRPDDLVSRSPVPFALDNLPKDPIERDLVIVALAKDLCSDSRGVGDNFWTEKASRALSVLISFFLAKVAIDSWSNILEQPDGKEKFLLEFVDWYVEARMKTFEADSDAPSREFFRVVLADANLANHKALKQEGKEVHFEWHIRHMNDLSSHLEKTLASILMTMECALSKMSPEIGLSISKLSPLWGFMSKKPNKNKSAYDDEPLSPFEVIIRSSATFSIRETNHFIAQAKAEEFFSEYDWRSRMGNCEG